MRAFISSALFVAIAFTSVSYGQSINYTNHWFYGSNAGLRFTGGNPAVVTGGQINTIEGTSAASDSVTGNLLFYTDGITVWNRNHLVMSNGTGLLGGGSSTQSALVVPDPANNGQYYIFTVPVSGAIGMNWSKVDMSLSGGLGAVTLKNQFLFSPSTERQTAVKHANGTDIWVMGQTPSGQFRSYRVTPTGVVGGAVTNIGPSSSGTIGQMKFSPNGDYLAWVDHGNGSAHLYDFDNATGAVSNYLSLATGFSKAAGCSFSPDNSKFYATLGSNYKDVYQWNLCESTPAQVAGSRVLVGSYTGGWGGMLQLALDGKIYYSHYSSQFLGVIANPNAQGAACNYNQNGLSISPQTCWTGTPNFVESVFLAAPGGSPISCTVLDADVLDLTAEATGDRMIVVRWTAREDDQFYKYAIQRRTANGFVTLGEQSAQGQSGQPASYEWPDANAHTGWNFYRLQMTDLDGSVSYSEVVQAQLDESLVGWTAYPVPASGELFLLRQEIAADAPARLQLINPLGQVVWSKQADAGVARVRVDLTGLAAGAYTLRAQQGGVLFSRVVMVR